MPSLSVVMPVHNTLPFLDQAIESILNQTYEDFELVILDDASTDGSTERLQEWERRDKRIRLIRSDHNLGPVGSSNAVANAARAPIVARMDGDDISYPDRLRQQIAVLNGNPAAGVVGSLCDIIDEQGAVIRTPEAWRLHRRSPFVPFAHGAMMYRRSVFEQVGGYRPECEYWEDQDLVVRMAEISEVFVVPRALYRIRAWTRSTRMVCDPHRLEESLNLVYAATDWLQHKGEYPPLSQVQPYRRINPRVFVAMGSVPLWAGGRPHLFKRFLKRAAPSPGAVAFATLVWTAWASVSPGSLRRVLVLLSRMRNLSARRTSPLAGAVRWDPFGGPIAAPASDRENSAAAPVLEHGATS